MTERSRAERQHRQGIPFGLLIPLSSFTPFHPQENWDAPMQGQRASALSSWAEQLGCALSARVPRFTASQSFFVLITHKTYRLAFV